MSIRSEESEIYQGKGRGGVLGKGKGTYIRGKEREVTSGERKGRCIREREGTNVRSKEREVSVGQGRRRVSVVRRGGKINVSAVRGDKGLFSLLYGIPLLSYPGTSIVHVWRATKTSHWQ